MTRKAGREDTRFSATTDVFYLILRRMRFPLILIIVIYTITVSGLALIPTQDEQGNPAPPMSLFEAFYVISYTSTTIGFGELPTPFTPLQRMWMTLSIYLSVIGWSYSVVTIISLVQERGFQNALQAARFSGRIHGLREPFYIVCGCGETGILVCHGLDRLGLRFVVIENDEDRIAELRLEDFRSDVPLMNADAGRPRTILEAGLQSPHCRGVMALAEEDETNQAIAVTMRLLAPAVPVLARIRDRETETEVGAFGGDLVINPFDEFASHLVTAVSRPEHYRLRSVLFGLPGEPISERHRPPRGHWIVCGFGRFGHAVTEHLRSAGVRVVVIDEMHYGEGGVDVFGTGTDQQSLRAAGIEHADGIVAGNSSDSKNLAIAVTARDLNPDIFIVTRQNERANRALFEAFAKDLSMIPSRIVAEEFLARITTPLLPDFIAMAAGQDAAWCAELTDRLERLRDGRIPDVWGVRVIHRDAGAVAERIAAGDLVQVGNLLADPYDRQQRLCAVVLLVRRDGHDTYLPPDDFRLEEADEVLLTGSPQAHRRIELTLHNLKVLSYVRTGKEGNGGVVWHWLTRGKLD